MDVMDEGLRCHPNNQVKRGTDYCKCHTLFCSMDKYCKTHLAA